MLVMKYLFALILFPLTYSAHSENVTCTATEVIHDVMFITCLIYPSGQIEDIRIKSNNISRTNESIVSPSCTYDGPANGQLYNTTECSMGINITILGPGLHQINVIVSYNYNVTFTSNDLLIPIYDELQEPFCKQPKFNNDSSLLFTVDCLAPLPYGRVDCLLKSRTNGTHIRDVNIYRVDVTNVLELRGSDNIAFKCHFIIMTNEMDAGYQEFQVVMSNPNSQGKMIARTSNWTTPEYFYHQTEMNFTVNGSPAGVEAKAGDVVTFLCTVDGFPPPTVLLSLDETPYIDNSTTDFHQKDIILPINGCQQAGLYRCGSIGRLKNSNYISKEAYVNIPSPLRLRSDKCAVDNRVYAGIFFKKSHVSLAVFGYPGPTSIRLSKSQVSDKSMVSDGVDILYTQDEGPFGKFEITFKNIDLMRNVENFTLSVENGVGNTFFDFSIQADSGMSMYHMHASTKNICLCFVYIMSRFMS